MILRHPISTLFPYTTLFRSQPGRCRTGDRAVRRGGGRGRLDRGLRPVGLDLSDRARHRADRGGGGGCARGRRSEEHTSELQSRRDLVCRLLLEKKNKITYY